MNLTDDFARYYAPLLEGIYDCVDRIVVNAYFRFGQYAGGFRTWWRAWAGSDDQLDDAHLMRLAGRFSRRVRAWAAAHQVPVLDCEPGTHKHEVAEQHLPTDPAFTGVFLILVSRAPALQWQVRRFANGGLQLQQRSPWAYVNHYSFHILDPDWGHITIKMSGHPPFGAQVILNGHEWVERRARRHGLTLIKEGNCFTATSDPAALAEIADTLNGPAVIGRLAEVCDRWIYSACLCFALDREAQQRSGFRYDYSSFQLEYSRNLRFARGSDLDQVYQSVIDRTRTALDVRTLTTLFGCKHRPHRRPHAAGTDTRPPIQVKLEKPTYDLTVFKVRFGPLQLKVYDKGERTLRIEATVENARKLPFPRALSSLPRLVTRLVETVLRFLNVLHGIDHAFLDAGVLDELPRPGHIGDQQVAGVDLNQARIRGVMEAIIALAPNPAGFSVAALAGKVRALTGAPETAYTTRQAAYDLRKLRGKALVEPMARSRRHQATLQGCQTMAALLILRERVIKPVLAGVVKKATPGRPKRQAPLDAHYKRLREEMQATFATLGIAVETA